MNVKKQSWSIPGSGRGRVGVAIVVDSVTSTVDEFVQMSEHVRLYIIELSSWFSSSGISRMKRLAMSGAMNAPKDQLK